jgi:hypothetical protein
MPTLAAALECRTGACEVHAAVGFAVVGGWLVLFLLGLGAFVLRREPGPWFWRLLAVLQAVLLLQVVLGLVLLATGHRQELLHYLYGSLFPAIVLVVAHVLGRGMQDEADTWKVFAVAAFFIVGLTLRALTTGLGIG